MLTKINFKYPLMIFTVVVNFLIVYFSYPLFYSNDGAAYLSSARSLFTKDVGLAYEWLREPGYPLFLRILNDNFGNSGNVIIISQFVLLMGSLLIIANLLEKKINSKLSNFYWIIFFLTSTFSQIYFQYSSLVLQQSLFAFYLALYGLSTFLALKNKWFLLLFIPIIFLTNNSSIIFYYFNFLFIIFILITFVIDKIKISQVFVVVILSLFFLNLTSTNFWNSYKESNLKSLVIPVELKDEFLHTSGKTNSVTAPKVGEDYILDLLSVRSISSFKDLTYSGIDKSENNYFLSLLLDNTFTCGGNVATEAVYYRNYSQFYFDYGCKNIQIRELIHKKLQNFYYYFYSIVLIFFFIFLVSKLRSKSFYIFTLIPLVYCFLYVITFGQVDRYFVSIYPFALSVFCYSLAKFMEKRFIV